MALPTRQSLLANRAYQLMWGRVMEGFKLISGDGWEGRADYAQFWKLSQQLYEMGRGGNTALKLPDGLKASLGFMFAGHAGRTRKGLRRRPYFHHILMMVYLAWLCGLDETSQLAAIHHDDVEDLPKNLNVPEEWVKQRIHDLAGAPVLAIVVGLSNKYHRRGKHAGQVEKMGQVDVRTGTLKLLDRAANLFDMRQDKPKDHTPEVIRRKCLEAWQLAEAMPVPAPEIVLAMLAFAIDLLEKENDLLPAAA